MDLLDLVPKYEPVLKFSKDGKGREENFSPFRRLITWPSRPFTKRGRAS